MENLKLDLDIDKSQSLDEWVEDIMSPVLEAIGAVSESLEKLYQELR